MLNEADIIEVPITTAVMTEAHIKSTDMGTLYKSITAGQGNLAGFIGEGLIHEYFINAGETIDWTNTYEYDMILNYDLLLDIKTKRTGYKPKLDYDCSISDGKRQRCDHYIFTRVKNDFSVGWILGYMPSKEYFEVANFMEKGVIDPSNGWKVSRDCWNLPIQELRNINELVTFDKGTISS